MEGRWILRALVVLVGVALLCGYLTFCGLFYQGQWQMVMHPVRTDAQPALPSGRSYDVVRFGPGATGVPQRVGWWIPPSDGPYRGVTLLYLPSGDGALADQAELLGALSDSGVAIFGFDWRAYGASAMLRRPSEATMRDDAEAAYQYLVAARGLHPSAIVPYGRDLGAAVALWLCGQHKEIPAMALDQPRFHVSADVANDARVRLLPVGLLLKDRFELEPMLRESHTPKLIVLQGGQGSPDERESGSALQAGDPKMTVTLPHRDPKALQGALRRFLGQYAPAALKSEPVSSTSQGRER